MQVTDRLNAVLIKENLQKFPKCKIAFWLFVFYRASFDSSAQPSKRKSQTEGEDTEEDVEEQKVSLYGMA